VNNINQLDTDLLAGYIANLGKDIVQQMLDLYVQQSVIYLQDIKQSMIDESQSLWQEHCHKMKGAAGSVGLLAVYDSLVKIEKSADDWPLKSKTCESLNALNQAGITTFRAWLALKK
jgi:HPt (histidine-containing phosphotransfer) domain-containing protein